MLRPYYYLYILDSNERIVGVISLKNLILAMPQALLSDVMITPVKTLTLEASQKDVAEFISKYNLLAAPVVDENNVLRGIVTVDDVVISSTYGIQEKAKKTVNC